MVMMTDAAGTRGRRDRAVDGLDRAAARNGVALEIIVRVGVRSRAGRGCRLRRGHRQTREGRGMKRLRNSIARGRVSWGRRSRLRMAVVVVVVVLRVMVVVVVMHGLLVRLRRARKSAVVTLACGRRRLSNVGFHETREARRRMIQSRGGGSGGGGGGSSSRTLLLIRAVISMGRRTTLSMVRMLERELMGTRKLVTVG
jgi:hypothetical protein